MSEKIELIANEQKGSEVSERNKFYKGIPEGPVRSEGLVLSGIYESKDGAETKAIPVTQPAEITVMLDGLEIRRAELETSQFIPDGDPKSRKLVTEAFKALLLSKPDAPESAG